jgi:hypothetical protein
MSDVLELLLEVVSAGVAVLTMAAVAVVLAALPEWRSQHPRKP